MVVGAIRCNKGGRQGMKFMKFTLFRGFRGALSRARIEKGAREALPRHPQG
jgi:hypothetical protein